MDCNRNQNLAILFLILAFCVWCHFTTAEGVTLTTSYVDVACPATEITFTCSISGGILIWAVISSRSGQVDTSFIGDQPTPARQLTSDGVVFTASVTSPPPNFVSTLSTTATTSLEGVRVRCLDGDNLMTMETDIHIATPPSIPLNLRIVATQNSTASSTVTLQWDPPSGGDDVDNYTLTVTPGGSSRVYTVTMVTIELSYNTEYTVRVSATNCAGRGPEAVLGPFTVTRVDCMAPSAANGVIIEQFTSTTEGSRIRFYCSETFVPNDVREAVCESNGSWNPDPGQHVCTLVDCGSPQPPANSTLINSTGTLKGQKVTFQCTADPNQIITSVCTSVSDSSSEGVWSPDLQQVMCGARCSPPSVPSNGFLGEVTETTAVFGCNEGYSPQGTTTAVCVANDTWSPDPAQLECTSNVCSPLITADATCPCNGQVTTAAVSSAVVCSVVFYILGVVSTILTYLAVTRCRKKNDHEKSSTDNEGREPQASGPVYEDIIPVQDTEKAGIELQENVAYGPVKK